MKRFWRIDMFRERRSENMMDGIFTYGVFVKNQRGL